MMDGHKIYHTVTGRVYYELTEGGVGNIKIITFGELPEHETKGLLSVVMDPTYLIPFVGRSISLSQYMLVFSSTGVPTIVKRHSEITLGLYEEVFRPVEPHNEQPGMIMMVDGKGSASVVAHQLPVQSYPDHSIVSLFITKVGQPNLLMKSHRFTLGSTTEGNGVLVDLPVGVPGKDYSVWAITPGPVTPLWWSSS